MLTKGIVEKLIDSYKIKVRIPVYNKPNYVNGATSTDNLYEACICTLPNCYINVQVGDIVILGFEDDDTSQPIILGCLYAKDITDSKIDLISNSLQALNSATLPQNTSIGKVTARDLGYLTGLKSNVQGQIDTISNYQTNQAMKWQSYVNHNVTEDLATNELIIPIVGLEKISQYRIFTDIYSSKTNNEAINASFIDSKGNERNLFSFSSVSPIDNGEEANVPILYYSTYSEGLCINSNYIQTVCGSFSTSSSGGYILEDGIKLSNSLIDIKSLKIKLSSGSLIKKGTKISMEVLYK